MLIEASALTVTCPSPAFTCSVPFTSCIRVQDDFLLKERSEIFFEHRTSYLPAGSTDITYSPNSLAVTMRFWLVPTFVAVTTH